ncbi:MliC family protein [Pseudomarimonas salicorniae]|uniref:MliC family protein n=1 Tax=Pseudomarimonas salicorniae TaxID=2933270 RepID=A0ABT0GE36_9GAMM|nr:MliC family protein [Lysobacter sp. CAU 1642]MCK7592260.1 MliC family protein [Lysobacter sp. CAU 1642]
MRHLPRLFIAWLPLLGLVACAGTPEHSAPPAASASVKAPSGRLSGQILLPRELTAPPAGRLQLLLVPRFNPSPTTLASASIAFDTPPPWSFELPFERKAVADPTLFRLDVALFDAAGQLRFVSDGEHPVNLDVEAEPTRIELIPLSDTDDRVLQADCGGTTLTLQFSGPDLVLSVDGEPHRLRRAYSAVGERYIGPDAELWLQPDRARVQLGERSLSCAAARPAGP